MGWRQMAEMSLLGTENLGNGARLFVPFALIWNVQLDIHPVKK